MRIPPRHGEGAYVFEQANVMGLKHAGEVSQFASGMADGEDCRQVRPSITQLPTYQITRFFPPQAMPVLPEVLPAQRQFADPPTLCLLPPAQSPEDCVHGGGRRVRRRSSL